MSDRVKSIYRHAYLESFSCIGGACEDTCCIGWDVDIDHRTFMTYEQLESGPLADDLHRLIKKNPVSNDPGIDFARVILKSGKRCPFLDNQKLCMIQAGLGEEALSNVCAGFPRFYNQVGDILEETATLSCPEIARKLLLDPNSMDAVVIPVESFNRSPERVIVGRKVRKSLVLDKTRELLHHVMDGPYTLYSALVVIGGHVKLVSDVMKSGDESVFLKSHGVFMDQLNSTEEHTDFMAKEDELTPDLQGITLMDFYHQKLKVGTEVKDERFIGLCTRSLEAFGKKRGVQVKAYHKHFIEMHMKYGKHCMETHDQSMKREMIHHLIKTLYPLTDGMEVATAFRMLVVREAWLVWLMTGLAASSGTRMLSEEDFVLMYQSYCKVVEHHKSYLDEVRQHLELMGNIDPVRFARLVHLSGPMGK